MQSDTGFPTNAGDLSKMLVDGAKPFGHQPHHGQVELLLQYMALLKEWNEKINLTAIEEDCDIILKHFIDSFTILPYLTEGCKSLIDVGTGAGFPGIPVKIIRPDLPVMLADSLDKRVKFLHEAIRVLKLEHIGAIHGRAEDLGQKQEFREKYDVAVARAVANLPVLLEYCLPFVKTGGVFIAMKGSSLDEVGTSGKALDVLGGKVEAIHEITLPFGGHKRNILIIRKFRQTPTNYPRKAGKPSKNPLL